MQVPDGSPASRALEAQLLRILPAHLEIVRRFFESLSSDNQATTMFHPHPFTQEHAELIAQYSGQDYYAAMLINDAIVAYGMLRGWDEGYETPSLGIVVNGAHRGLGFGRVMMDHLHAEARARGAKSIMLKVYKNNTAATQLYRRMGYVLSDLNEQEWRGIFDLQGAS